MQEFYNLLASISSADGCLGCSDELSFSRERFTPRVAVMFCAIVLLVAIGLALIYIER